MVDGAMFVGAALVAADGDVVGAWSNNNSHFFAENAQNISTHKSNWS